MQEHAAFETKETYPASLEAGYGLGATKLSSEKSGLSCGVGSTSKTSTPAAQGRPALSVTTQPRVSAVSGALMTT
ncbi:MAG: hypothetical protein NTZ50_15310 [Chloroflexi bacterium]|nr:hypothetical protein [Chloroflexota bacterium]